MNTAIEQWKSHVEAHHAQSLRAQERWSAPPDDFWRPYATHFRADPRRTDDPMLNRLAQEVSPDATVLDVGGGAGRFALPLALHCRHVTVVEPSESMLEELRLGAREAGIGNLSVVQGTWEEVEIESADVVLCVHVLYGIADVATFIRKLDSHARERVVLPMFTHSPQSGLSSLWKYVHGEERVDLPALPELIPVLWEMEIYPDLEMMETGGVQTFENRQAAVEQLRRRLYVSPGSEQDGRLHTAVDELLVETADSLEVRGAKPRRLGLIAWRPERASESPA